MTGIAVSGMCFGFLLLMKQVKESLADRYRIIEMYPLVLPKFLTGRFDDPVRPSFFVRLLDGSAKPEISPFFSLTGNYAAKPADDEISPPSTCSL
jgi:hypothetical protein